MLKHIVSILARNPHEVVVLHKVTDGHKTALADTVVNAYMGAYSVRTGEHPPYRSAPRFIVRITDIRQHEHILADLKKQAMCELHADIHTEFRMNED